MRATMTTGAVLLALSAGTSDATGYTDCLTARDGSKRLEACDTVLRGREFTDSQKARAHRERGSLLAEAGTHADAVDAFTAAIKLAPDDVRSYEKRGLAYLVLKNHAAAIADLSEAIRRQSSDARLLTVRGYAFLVTNELDKAIVDFNAAIKLQPKNAVAYNNRGLAFRKKGNLDQALQDYATAIRLSPNYALAYANRGYALEAAGRKKEAIAAFQSALTIDNQMRGAIDGLKRLGVTSASERITTVVAEGKTLATILCSRCHAIDRKDVSTNPNAPAFRTLTSRYPLLEIREPITRGIAAPHREMPAFNLTSQDVDKIIAYVNSLNSPR
ncbi:MAG: tetratricopeptide repeat protein [Pseudomonadota bacterium]